MEFLVQPPKPLQPSSHHQLLQTQPSGVNARIKASLTVPSLPSPSSYIQYPPSAPPQEQEHQPLHQSQLLQQQHMTRGLTGELSGFGPLPGDKEETDRGGGKKKTSKLSHELKVYFRTCFQSWEGHPYDRKFFFEALAKRTGVPRPVITKYYYNDRRRNPEYYHDISHHKVPSTTTVAGTGTDTKRSRRPPLGEFAGCRGSIDTSAVDKRFEEANWMMGGTGGMGYTKRTSVWGIRTNQKTSEGGGRDEGGGGGAEPFLTNFLPAAAQTHLSESQMCHNNIYLSVADGPLRPCSP